MSVPSTLTIATGNQSFRHSSGKIAAFVMKGNDTFDRELHSKVLKEINHGTVIYAHKENIQEFGRYFQKGYEAQENKVLCFQASTTKHGGNWSDGMLFVMMSSDAPLISIDFYPIADRLSGNQKIQIFMGRGYMISRDELKDYGIDLGGRYKQFFRKEELEELFVVEELSKGTPKPTIERVKDSQGREKAIRVPSGRGRKVRLGKLD